MSELMDKVVAIRYKVRNDPITNRYLYRRKDERFYKFEQRFFTLCFTLGYVVTELKYVCEYDSV